MSGNSRRQALIKILKDFIVELEQKLEKTVPVPVDFEYRKKKYEGVGIPVMSSCENGVCQQVDITLNKKYIGVLKHTKNGWKISDIPQGPTTAIRKEVERNYEYV